MASIFIFTSAILSLVCALVIHHRLASRVYVIPVCVLSLTALAVSAPDFSLVQLSIGLVLFVCLLPVYLWGLSKNA